ncbi:MAG: ABC transporter ATP-binding protein, partial [Clostridia bacterium]|nr:ABC transporter ATP-binding protein [Clostridia bacterium]
MNKEVKLSVNNLKISFRTDAGKVQAVRDISFDLYKGETLAIVGESGSGKSVTSKAIMGISAINSIHEGGEILYDGQDLVRIPEEEMHKLRGDKIAMIFQDPLSSLNPIMRIGRQITEAMLLKNKANRKEGRETFNTMLADLSAMMTEALESNHRSGIKTSDVAEYIKTFDSFNIEAIKLENSYNDARTAAEEMIAIIDDCLFLTEKNQKVDVVATLKLVSRKLADINDKYFTAGFTEALTECKTKLGAVKRVEKKKVSAVDSVKAVVTMSAAKRLASDETAEVLREIRKTAEEMLAQPQYNFFRIGYYVYKNPNADLSTMPAEEANEMAYKFLMQDFMNYFMTLEKIAVEYSNAKMLKNKKEAIAAMQKAISFFKSGNFTEKEAMEECKNVNKSVTAAIDPLAVVKDNVAYTFGGALEREIKKYFFYLENNPKEEKRFERQTAKREALIAKGKNVDWEVIPKSIIEPEEQIEAIVSVITRVMNKFNADVESAATFDADKRCVEIIDYLKGKASQIVYTLFRSSKITSCVTCTSNADFSTSCT